VEDAALLRQLADRVAIPPVTTFIGSSARARAGASTPSRRPSSGAGAIKTCTVRFAVPRPILPP